MSNLKTLFSTSSNRRIFQFINNPSFKFYLLANFVSKLPPIVVRSLSFFSSLVRTHVLVQDLQNANGMQQSPNFTRLGCSQNLLMLYFRSVLDQIYVMNTYLKAIQWGFRSLFHRQIQAFVQYIYTNWYDPMNVNTIHAQCYVSKSSLSLTNSGTPLQRYFT